jgi:DNA helicase IV
MKITNEEEYQQALKRLDEIWSMEETVASVKTERKDLVEAVLKYEEETVETPKPSTIDAITFRKEQSTVELDENNYQQVYDEFWKHLVETDGVLDLEQVKKELCDYYNMIQEMMTLTYDLTDGLLSYPNYKASTILTEHGAIDDKVVREAVEEAVGEYKEKLKELEQDVSNLEEKNSNLEQELSLWSGGYE